MYNYLNYYLNQSLIWLEWPPWLHVGHHENQYEKLLTLCPVNTYEVLDVNCFPDVFLNGTLALAVPKCARHSAHLGSGLWQLGHDVNWKNLFLLIKNIYFIL